MHTTHPNHKRTTKYSWNRRIAALLAFILLFQSIFNGVQVRAGQTATPAGAATATPIPTDNYTINFSPAGAWSGYAQYNVTITNTTSAPLENIALAARWQDVEIDAIWSATAQKKADTIYIFPLEWSATIAPQSILTFGIIIKGNDEHLLPPEHAALYPLEDLEAVFLGQKLLPPWDETAPTPEPAPTTQPVPSTAPIQTPSSGPTPTATTVLTAEPDTTPVPTGIPAPTASPAVTPELPPTAEPTITPTATPAPESTPTPAPTAKPTPTAEPTPTPEPTTPPKLTAEIASTQTATYGYTEAPQTSIRITNIGGGTSAPFTPELAAGQNSPFTLTPPETTILAGGQQAKILITLRSSQDAGLYTDTLTLHVPGQADLTIPLLQQVNKQPVLAPAEIQIANITADTITLAQIPGYEYALTCSQAEQPLYQDSPVFTGLQPDTAYTLLMRKKETQNHTAGQITTAEVRTDAIPAPEPSPTPETAPTATATPEPVEDLYVDGALTLKGDTTCRNLYMSGTSLDLNGYTLTVEENLIQTSGSIYAGNAENTLAVKGNYTQNGGQLDISNAHAAIGGNYEQHGNSSLIMNGCSTDTLTICGSWTLNSTSTNLCRSGAIHLGGNLTQTNTACKNAAKQHADFHTYLDGSRPQTISLRENESGTMGTLHLNNTAGITFTQPLYAYDIHGLANMAGPDSITLHIAELRLTQDETLHGNLTLLGGNYNLNGHSLTITGNLTQNNGTILAGNAGNTLTVEKNYTQNGGELLMDNAHVTIRGNYEEHGGSTLHMAGRKKDTLTIEGNWLVNTTSPNLYNYGTIRLHGNLTRTDTACKNQIRQDEDTRIHLQGSRPQTISLGSPQSGTLGSLCLDNTAGITFTQPLHACGIQGLTNIQNPDGLQMNISSLELTQDETLHGNLILLGGNYELNGHNLTITGNLTQNDGTIRAENAGNTLSIDGNYTQNGGELLMDNAHVTIGGHYEQNNYSRLYMSGARGDTLTIRKDWLINTANSNIYNYGTIHLRGDLIQTEEASERSLQMDEDLTIRFTGQDEEQYVSLAHPDTSRFGKTCLDNTEGVYFDQKLRAHTIHGVPACDEWDTLEIDAGTLKLTADTTSRGNLIIHDDVNLGGHTWNIGGNLRQTGGTIHAGNSTLTINGNYTAKSGALDIGTGQAAIGGNYYLVGDAGLLMQEAGAGVTVNGDMRIGTTASQVGNLTAGTLTLRGNLKQLEGASQNSFVQDETFTLTLAGADIQHVSLLYPEDSIFNNLQITSKGGVEFQSAISFRGLKGWENIQNERLTISQTYWTLKESVLFSGSLTFLGGSIDLNGCTLDIGGDVMQADSAMHVNKGFLRIRGDYELAGSSSLYMIHPEDYVTVKGTFQTRSSLSHQSILRDGILTIGENLWQTGHPASFAATEDHMVYFSGEDCYAGFAYPDESQFAHVTGDYHSNADFTFKTAVRTVKFVEGLGDGIRETGENIGKFLHDPDRVLADGPSVVVIMQTLIAVFAEGEAAAVASAALLVEMAWMMCNSPELVHYNDNKEEVAYDLGHILGGMLLVGAVLNGVKDLLNALRNQISVQSMLDTAKLQYQGILGKEEALALATGDSGGIIVGVGEVFGAEGAAVVEGAGLTVVEEGMVLKVGRILALTTPGLLMNKEMAEEISEKVKEGDEEPTEIAEDIAKWDSGNIDVEKLFTDKSIEHLETIEGFDKRNGVKGAHTMDSFNEFAEGPRPVEILDTEEVSGGIKEITYKVGKIDRTNKPILKPDGKYDFFDPEYTKTVFDTSELSTEQIVSMAKEAFASGEVLTTEGGQLMIRGISKNGVKFEGWIDLKTEKLKSFYPVKEFSK